MAAVVFTDPGPWPHRYVWEMDADVPGVMFHYRCQVCGARETNLGFDWIGPGPSLAEVMTRLHERAATVDRKALCQRPPR